MHVRSQWSVVSSQLLVFGLWSSVFELCVRRFALCAWLFALCSYKNPLPSVVRWQRALDSFERLSKAKFNTPEHNRQPTARTIDVHGRARRGCDVFYQQSLWRFYT
jgi:hypothetical protein